MFIWTHCFPNIASPFHFYLTFKNVWLSAKPLSPFLSSFLHSSQQFFLTIIIADSACANACFSILIFYPNKKCLVAFPWDLRFQRNSNVFVEKKKRKRVSRICTITSHFCWELRLVTYKFELELVLNLQNGPHLKDNTANNITQNIKKKVLFCNMCLIWNENRILVWQTTLKTKLWYEPNSKFMEDGTLWRLSELI